MTFSYINVDFGKVDPLVVTAGESCESVKEVEWHVDRLWLNNIRGPDLGWVSRRAIDKVKKRASYWTDNLTIKKLLNSKCEIQTFECIDCNGGRVDSVIAFEPNVDLGEIVDEKPNGKKRAAFQYLRDNQPKIAKSGLAILEASLLIRQDIWDGLNFGDRFIKRTSFVDLQAEKIIPMGRMKQPAPIPKVDLAAHCRRLRVARARGEKGAALKPGLPSVVRRFLGCLGARKRQLRYHEGANMPEYVFRGFLRPGDPGFAGVALKAFMTDDSSKPPGKMAVIGTTQTGDALAMDLQSQGGAVYWFDHERGEFLPLEDHIGGFLIKCVAHEA